jgi:hypothetical protein
VNITAESTAAPPHRPCIELERKSVGLDNDAVHRFVLGLDEQPRKLSRDEAAQQLGDRFAEVLFLKGKFPLTAGDVLADIQAGVSDADPLKTQQFFLVGEGTQLPPGTNVSRNLRFLVSCGDGPGGPDVMVSAFHPDQGTVEVMAWDLKAGGFNYYRTVGDSTAWVFAGNSRHALTQPTRDSGPFESHKSGHFLMKELRVPWVNWDSPKARVNLSIFAESGLLDHPWTKQLEPGGAYTLEESVAKPAMQRWTEARLAALVAGASAEAPRRVLEQLLTSLTVNLASSNTSSAAAVAGSTPQFDLPDSFFVDSAALSGVLDLAAPPQPFVSSAIYTASLASIGATLTDGAQFSQAGDTHFAFVVPERAFEDTDTIRQAMDRGIVSRRLAACLLMVDFPNPIFSERREHLLRLVPDAPFSGSVDFSQSVADAIKATPAAAQVGTPEEEFARHWDVGEAFEATFNAELQSYYDAFATQLATQQGFESYVRLAESRRLKVKDMPIAESDMLFAQTNVAEQQRRMRADATVEEV